MSQPRASSSRTEDASAGGQAGRVSDVRQPSPPSFSVSRCIIRFLVLFLLTVLSPSAVMRALHILPFLVPALAGALAAAPPHDIHALDVPVASGSNLNTHEEILFRRDGDHHHHGAPLVELNETEVEMTHQKTPPSYYWSDIMDSQGEKRYPGLMVVHVLSMAFAFFGALPAGKSPLFRQTPYAFSLLRSLTDVRTPPQASLCAQ